MPIKEWQFDSANRIQQLPKAMRVSSLQTMMNYRCKSHLLWGSGRNQPRSGFERADALSWIQKAKPFVGCMVKPYKKMEKDEE